MNAAPKRTSPHSPGSPITAWFVDGPMAGRSMTVRADTHGLAPAQVQVAHLPAPRMEDTGWRDAPSIDRPATAVYRQLRPLDTVPWSYEYALAVPLNDNPNGAPTA